MRASLEQIYDHVIGVLESELPDFLTYHCVDHTKYVFRKSKYIAEKEDLSDEEIFLIQVAALYHDIGFIISNLEHEAIGCNIARKELPAYGFSSEEIEKICGMIMATRIPQTPKNIMESVLADADLEYLATNHFEEVSELLYKELLHYNPKLSRGDWNDIQISFINAHNYHTDYCRRYKEFRKRNNLEELIESVAD